MIRFNGLKGQMARLEFIIELLMKLMGNEDCSKTLEKAEYGNVFEEKTIKSIKKKVKKISILQETEKEIEIWVFRKKLFSMIWKNKKVPSK